MSKEKLPPVDRYPLTWPVGSPRTPKDKRKPDQFRGPDKRPIEIDRALRRVVDELDRLGIDKGTAVLSSNVPVGLAGLAGSTPTDNDPGVAIYFTHKGKPIVFACDTYTRVAGNIAAIGNHIEAIRAIERYGVGRLEQILVGFQRLLSGKRSWFDVLGVPGDAPRNDQSWAAIEDKFKKLAKKYHPDVHKDSDGMMVEINEAFQAAKQEFGR